MPKSNTGGAITLRVVITRTVSPSISALNSRRCSCIICRWAALPPVLRIPCLWLSIIGLKKLIFRLAGYLVDAVDLPFTSVAALTLLNTTRKLWPPDGVAEAFIDNLQRRGAGV